MQTVMQNIKPVTMIKKTKIKAQGGPVGSIMVFSVVVVGSSVVGSEVTCAAEVQCGQKSVLLTSGNVVG